jgi:undecaprenyl phosphate-alpha-L-ara4N flippase subunit ArnE
MRVGLLVQIGLAAFVVTGMSCGQILFKFASSRGMGPATLTSPSFLAAVALYGLVTIGWVYFLKTVPLSRAYPVMALSYVVVPVLASAVFGEALGARYWIGMLLLVGGIVLATT